MLSYMRLYPSVLNTSVLQNLTAGRVRPSLRSGTHAVCGVLLTLLLDVGACAHAAEESADPAAAPKTTNLTSMLRIVPAAGVKSNVNLVSRPLIAGLWIMTIPDVACHENYNFQEDGNFLVQSAGEWTQGKYVYTLPDADAMEKTLPLLTMLIQYDNKVTDCSGNNIDQSGEVQREYVKWIDPAHIEFCATEDGQQCALKLRKLLP
jgi:hypothetical protein